MILGAAIASSNGQIFYYKHINEKRHILVNYIKEFFVRLDQDDQEAAELTYIETQNVRYIYKQTNDVYWIIVMRIDSDLFADIHILGKFVSTIIESGPWETNSQNITDYQKGLFYRHIWHPWDGECQYCGFQLVPELWTRKFESKLKFLIEIANNQIQTSDIDYYNQLIDEAWACAAELDSHGSEDCDEIDEETLINCCRLKCRLEDFHVEATRIEDPYLRIFAKRDLLINQDAIHEQSIFNPDQTLQVGFQMMTE